MTHDFARSLERGHAGERVLDDVFARWYDITPASATMQRRGVDRIFDNGGVQWTVEYKTDDRAGETGNAYIETVSVDVKDKAGWAFTTWAIWLVYYVPTRNLAYVIDTITLKQTLDAWCEAYPSATADNGTYASEGVLVPLDVLEGVARRVVTVEDPKSESTPRGESAERSTR